MRCPPWAIASDVSEALAAAEEIGYPLLVRPSYVLGGRAMRICYDAEQLEAAMAAVDANVLLDRFVENAIELDVDALCDGADVYIGAVMQHVEEAGVHSGDSACVLPAPSLTLAAALEVEHVVQRLGPALGVVGLLNVQLAIADSSVYVLEVNPRASRTVPFASKAIGVNLVDAACRLAAGATLAELDLPVPRPTQVSVKAAVLPFARFPGADPVLGPEMRSTGEVMASAADLPTALAKAERAAGRPLPTSGPPSSRFEDEDKPAAVPVAAALAGLGFELSQRKARRARCARPGSRSRRWRRSRTPTTRWRPSSISCATAAAISSSTRHRAAAPARTATSSARPRSLRVCRASRRSRVPPRPCMRSRMRAPSRRSRCRSASGSRRERRDASASDRALGASRSGRTRCSGSNAADSSPGLPGQFFMLEVPGRVLPRPMSLCHAPAGELAFLMEPIGPGTRALCALEPGAEIHVFGPLGNGFDLDVARPLLVAGGIGIAPMPYVREALGGDAPAILGFRSDQHAEAARSSGRRGRRRAAARHRAAARGARRRARLRPEPMLEAIRNRVPRAQLAWEAPMACGYGACYGCVVERDGHYERLCVEGPVLQGRRVIPF